MLIRNLRRMFMIAGVCLAAGSSLRAQVSLLVTDRTNGAVTVLDRGLTVVGTVALPSSPSAADATGVSLNPAQTLAAVSNFNTNRIDFLDLTVSPPVVSGASVTFTSPALFPEDMVFSPDGACLLVSDGRPGAVASVDVVNRVVVSSLPTVQSQAVEFIPNNPNNIVLTADQVGNVIHVLTLGAGCTLTDTGTTVATPGTGPRNVTALPDGTVALVSHQDGPIGILSISGTTVSFTGSFSLGAANPVNRVQGIALNPGLGQAYAYQCETGNVEILNIDSSDNVTDSGVGVAGPVSSLCLLGVKQIATDGKSAFVSAGTNVSAINVTVNKVTGTYAPGSTLAGMAVKGSFPVRKPHH